MKQKQRAGAAMAAAVAALICVISLSAFAGVAAAAPNVTGLASPPGWAKVKPGQDLSTGGIEEGAPPLVYKGGAVQSFPELYLIFWGSNWSGETGTEERSALENMYTALPRSNWQGILSQYYGPSGHYVSFSSAPTVLGNWTDNSVTAAKEVNAESVSREVTAAIKSQGWQAATENPNTQFVLLPAPGTSFQYGYGAYTAFCGRHSAWGEHGATLSIILSPQGGRCFRLPTGPPSITFTASHEYAESATDPRPGTGWVSAEASEGSYTEGADMCVNEPPGHLNNGIVVTRFWDNRQNTCSESDTGPHPLSEPTSTTGPATAIEETAATLNATVNPEGSETHYYFEYGETTAYGSTSPYEGAGAGVFTVPARGAVANLRPGTIYHYRLVATNAGGTERGADRTLLTASTASGNPVAIRVGQAEVDVYRRGADGKIYGDVSAGAGWKGPYLLPVNAGGVAGSLTATQNGNGEVQLFWRGNDHKIYGDLSAGAGWKGPYLLATNPAGAGGDPTAVRVSSSELDLYWRGADNEIYGDLSAGAGWQGPFAVPTDPAGASGNPVAIQSAPGQAQLYWRGVDNRLYGDLSAGSGWQGPFAEPMNAAGVASDPSLVKVSPSEWDIYWRGADNKIYGDVSAGAGWTGPYPEPVNAAGAAGKPVTIGTGSGQVQLYWRGADAKLYGDLSAGSGWQGPYLEPTNTAGIAGDPSLVKISPSEWDAYWLGTDGVLYGDVSAGSGWQGPYTLP
jgi:hypothetical protein